MRSPQPGRQRPEDHVPSSSSKLGWGAGRGAWLAAAGLVIFTAVLYGRVAGFQFIHNYDDDMYVTDNPHVKTGLTLTNIAWNFAHPCAGNWHPVTMLSHMTDCQLFGLSPGPPHVVNLLLHLVNTVLLFYVLTLATRRAWLSLSVAALFALHPMHVESVAWVAERKDVLSTLFFLLTIWAYLRYVRLGNPVAYAPVLLFFAVGLMAKSMLVTLPFVLVLLDFWPLGRVRLAGPAGSAGAGSGISFWRSVQEKLPLFLLAAASIPFAFHAQRQAGALLDTSSVPLGLRLSNALVSYVTYVVGFFVPHGLAVFYPYPTGISLVSAAAAGLALVVITGVLVWTRKRAPYALVGWLWFVGMLVPVIGLVQVGSQSMADRYTYVPFIGLAIAVVWACADAVRHWNVGRDVVVAASVVVFGGLAVVTGWQVGYWQDARHLFQHAIEVTKGNYIAQNHYGEEELAAGNVDEALKCFQAAAQMNPRFDVAYLNLGTAYLQAGRAAEAIAAWQKNLEISPQDAEACNNLGLAYLQMGRSAEAMTYCRKALTLKPNLAQAHYNLANALYQLGRMQEAIAEYGEALSIKPDYVEAHCNLGSAMLQEGRVNEAITHYRRAVELDPGFTDALYNLGAALVQSGEVKGGTVEYEKVLALDPQYVNALNSLAWIRATSPEPSIRDAARAIASAELAERVTGGGNPAIEETLAAAYAAGGRWNEAMAVAQKALEKANAPGQEGLAALLQQHLRLYQTRHALGEPLPASLPVGSGAN